MVTPSKGGALWEAITSLGILLLKGIGVVSLEP